MLTPPATPQMSDLVPVLGPVARSVVSRIHAGWGVPRGHLVFSLWALRHVPAFPLDGISMQDITLPLVCILELSGPAWSIPASPGSEDADGPCFHPDDTHDRRQKVAKEGPSGPLGAGEPGVGVGVSEENPSIHISIGWKPSSRERAKG